MQFVAPGADIRPDWPLLQLAALVSSGRFGVVPGAVHDFGARTPSAGVLS